MNQEHWNTRAASIRSKGSQAPKARSLGGLHDRRRATEGQFFTADYVARGIWSVLGPNLPDDAAISVVDTSVGSGRLLAGAPGHCHLYGIDTDARCIDALNADAGHAERDYRFEVGALEDLSIRDFSVALINPPFSITLGSPLMTPYACTAHGRFGPGTSALSHEYALAQALEGADVVAAVLPASMRAACEANPRLAAIYCLPGDAFEQEGARVNTCVFIFSKERRKTPCLVCDVDDSNPWPALSLTLRARPRPVMRLGAVEEGKRTIHTPVTGDNTVRVEHHNRRIVLRFSCGLVEAKVRNAILVGDVAQDGEHRYPKDVRYVGDARLWMDTWLLQADPDEGMTGLMALIEAAGGRPVVAKNVEGFWKKLKNKHARAVAPFRRWVKSADVERVRIKAKRAHMLIAGDFSAPAVRVGDVLDARPVGGEYEVSKDGTTVLLRRDELEKRFDWVDADERASTSWVLKDEGLAAQFPELARQAHARLAAAGVDWLWPYQAQSVVELMLKPWGSVAAWKQGTGKARMAVALALMGGRYNLIVVESGLVPEMEREIRDKLTLDPELWRVIRAGDAVRNVELKKINVVSYNTLKKRVRRGKTLAQCLRRRCHTVIADEGGLLANIDSQQSRALLALSARKLIVSDGTPIANYPRNLYPVIAATAGNVRASQPYGLWNMGYLCERLMESASFAERGVDHFRDRHIVTQWVTNQFCEDNRSGAAREIPKIANVAEFRAWIGGLVQRRVRYEPEVEAFASCPKPVYQTNTVQWDSAHLAHYLEVVTRFAHWYAEHKRAQNDSGKGINLVVVLAKINAVIRAANHPHSANDFGSYAPLTSKMRAAIETLADCDARGEKVMLYASSPALLERIAHELEAQGVESVLFHGERPIKARTRDLDERFRFGDTNIILSSWVGQKGINVPQAKRIIFYSRSWSASTEDQAVCRTQRPDQDTRVVVEYLHLAGSIDEYMAQVVEWKQAAADSGLDWGDGATETDEFAHMDAIIEAFCRESLSPLKKRATGRNEAP